MTVSVPSWAPKVKYQYLSSANPDSDHLHLNQGAPFNCRGFQSTPGHREQTLWYFSMMAVLPSAMILPKLWWRPPQDSWLWEKWTGYIWASTSVFPSPWFFGFFSYTYIGGFPPSHFHLAQSKSQSIYLDGTLKPESLKSALKSTTLGLFTHILFKLN